MNLKAADLFLVECFLLDVSACVKVFSVCTEVFVIPVWLLYISAAVRCLLHSRVRSGYTGAQVFRSAAHGHSPSGCLTWAVLRGQVWIKHQYSGQLNMKMQTLYCSMSLVHKLTSVGGLLPPECFWRYVLNASYCSLKCSNAC